MGSEMCIRDRAESSAESSAGSSTEYGVLSTDGVREMGTACFWADASFGTPYSVLGCVLPNVTADRDGQPYLPLLPFKCLLRRLPRGVDGGLEGLGDFLVAELAGVEVVLEVVAFLAFPAGLIERRIDVHEPDVALLLAVGGEAGVELIQFRPLGLAGRARVVAMKTMAVSGLSLRRRFTYSRMRPSGASAGSPALTSLPPQWKTTTRGW